MKITNIIHKRLVPSGNNIIFDPENLSRPDKFLITKNPYRFPSLSWYSLFDFKKENDRLYISSIDWDDLL